MRAAKRVLIIVLALVVCSGCPQIAYMGRRAPAPTPNAVGSALLQTKKARTTNTQHSVQRPAQRPERANTKSTPVELIERAMGTRIHLKAYTTGNIGAAAAKKALHAGLDGLRRIETLMTTWRDDSEVSRINAAAGNAYVAVGSDTFSVIEKSLWIAARSEGVFDITFASMGRLWHFDNDLPQNIPTAPAIAAALKHVDYRRVLLQHKDRSIKLARKSTRINLGGIAKGYAIDRVASILRKAGLKSFFAQAGGDLYVEGKKPDGSAWQVGVRDPRGLPGDYFAVLAIEDHAFSTAGDYERAFLSEGKRYHHIIDPRTGYPATACRSVTVWAKDALTADAIDDAVFILGVEKGLALVESIDDCGAVIVDQHNKVWVSRRLKGLVKILRPPTAGV